MACVGKCVVDGKVGVQLAMEVKTISGTKNGKESWDYSVA